MSMDTAAVTSDASSNARYRTARQTPEFPGCRPMPLKREDVSDYDGRFEYWDGDAEIAWVAEPTTATHERPPHRLSGLVQIIAGVRGSPIECYGSMDLLLRDERGRKWRILQADQSVYLHPERVRRLTQAMEIGQHGISPTWCWRWTTPRTSAGGSSGCTRRGASPRSGWTCRRRGMRCAAPRGCRRDSRSTC